MPHFFKNKSVKHALFFATLMLATSFIMRGSENSEMIVLLFVAAYVATTPKSKDRSCP
ncbi:MAG: hypothetical protein KAI28_04600 [Sphingomonadales bacterium]|nr:hypothetical protein [Sphingomonadales bacterium]